MGKVKTEQIKRVGKDLMSRFPDKFTRNFDDNKRLVDELTKGATNRIRNQIAGYITSACSVARAEDEIESPEGEETED